MNSFSTQKVSPEKRIEIINHISRLKKEREEIVENVSDFAFRLAERNVNTFIESILKVSASCTNRFQFDLMLCKSNSFGEYLGPTEDELAMNYKEIGGNTEVNNRIITQALESYFQKIVETLESLDRVLTVKFFVEERSLKIDDIKSENPFRKVNVPFNLKCVYTLDF